MYTKLKPLDCGRDRDWMIDQNQTIVIVVIVL